MSNSIKHEKILKKLSNLFNLSRDILIKKHNKTDDEIKIGDFDINKKIHLCDNELIHLKTNNRKISIFKDYERSKFKILEHKEDDHITILSKFNMLSENNDIVNIGKDKNDFDEILDSINKATKILENELKPQTKRKNKL
tara:strand:- start:16501 stop:16920 length:420 start_codon:yes stop_codon:yes gene_type:complete